MPSLHVVTDDATTEAAQVVRDATPETTHAPSRPVALSGSGTPCPAAGRSPDKVVSGDA